VKQVPVGEFKARFSELLDCVQRGERIAIQYGKKRETVALLVPPEPANLQPRRLGVLKGNANFKIKPDFKMTESEFAGE
jgi:antitoxin (DNA-binding transcriptional repressor) of toxin-antitoxin stability system